MKASEIFTKYRINRKHSKYFICNSKNNITEKTISCLRFRVTKFGRGKTGIIDLKYINKIK